MTNDKALCTLRWFVFRARRVAEHSLLADPERLRSWARGTMKISYVPGGESSMTIDLPEEEPFESLAGRVRPFLMQSDDLYFKKVFRSLRGFTSPDELLTATVAALEEHWAKIDPKSRATLGYATRVGRVGEPRGELIPDSKLADAWLYCDFGHGDTNVADRVGQNDLDARYQAAVLVIANVALCVTTALHHVRRAWEDGLIPLDETDFTSSVLAQPRRTRPIADMATAPVGTPLEDIEAELDRRADGGVPNRVH